MGLLDSILGGAPDKSGLSAATKALLLVLAAKAAKDYFTHHQQSAQPGPQGAGAPASGGGVGGILGSILGGQAGGGGGLRAILGGQAGGGGLSSILGGGGGLSGLLTGLGGAGALGALVDQFGKNGHADTMNSWIGPGANQPIAPDQLAGVLGEGPLQELQARTGLSRQALLEQLAHDLPSAVDHITPQGRLPSDQELAAGPGAPSAEDADRSV